MSCGVNVMAERPSPICHNVKVQNIKPNIVIIYSKVPLAPAVVSGPGMLAVGVWGAVGYKLGLLWIGYIYQAHYRDAQLDCDLGNLKA